MKKFNIKYICEEGWEGRCRDHLIWEGETKEEVFKKMLRENARVQKQFKSFEFEDYDVADEYDAWWASLKPEERAAIVEA